MSNYIGTNQSTESYQWTKEEILPLYQTLRSYLQHEDSLINNRLSWLLTGQSLLFAGYGISLTQKVENAGDLRIVLMFVGILTSGVSFYSIYGASRAIAKLEKIWNRVKDICPTLPPLTGGGDLEHRSWFFDGFFSGVAAPYGIPLLFCISWTRLGRSEYFILVCGFFAIFFILVFIYKSFKTSLNDFNEMNSK